MDADQPLSEEDFLRKVESKRAVARAMENNRLACQEAWLAAGFGVEFALKALIIRRERLNTWPSREARPELYTHDLRALFRLASIDWRTAPAEMRECIRTVLDWNRAHEYTPGGMSRKNAQSMVAAAFDPDGVVAWLSGR